MTPEDLQELRDWSALKMGWFYCGNKDGFTTFSTKEEFEGEIYDKIFSLIWTPDTDLNQAFQVVERMREKGWFIMLHNDTGNAGYRAEFDKHGMKKGYGRTDNPCLAILLAARATEGE